MASESNPTSTTESVDVNAYVARAEEFLREMLPLTRLALNVRGEPGNRGEGDLETPDVVIQFEGRDEDLLLENQGELLTALEHLVQKVIRIPPAISEKIGFDCRDWRLLRVRELKMTAEAAAERVRQTGLPFEFGPMRARERRILHLALKDDTEIHATSEGQGPERRVVVYPGPASS